MMVFAAACLAAYIGPAQAPKVQKVQKTAPAGLDVFAVQEVQADNTSKTVLLSLDTVKQNCGACHSPTPESKALVCPKGHGTLNESSFAQFNVAQDLVVEGVPYSVPLSCAPSPADRLGLTLKPVGEGLRSHLKLAAGCGLLVENVAKDSALCDVDVKKYDVLVAVDDTPVKEPQKAVDLVLACVKDDKTLSLKLVREGKPQVANIQLAPTVRARLLDATKPVENRYRIGVALAGVDETLRQHLKIPAGEGAVVTTVEADSAAAEAQIKPHDILLRWEGQPVSGSESLITLIQKHGDKPAKVTLFRDGKKSVANVKPKTAAAATAVFEVQGEWLARTTSADVTAPAVNRLFLTRAAVDLNCRPAEGSVESEIAAALEQTRALQVALERLQAKVASKKEAAKPTEKK
jgi:hypothetical protein